MQFREAQLGEIRPVCPRGCPGTVHCHGHYERYALRSGTAKDKIERYLIEGWKRKRDGSWSAPLAAEPKRVLRDGQLWGAFSYDQAARQITMKTGDDPRLHVFETVLREQGIVLHGGKDTKIEGITVVDTLKASAANL